MDTARAARHPRRGPQQHNALWVAPVVGAVVAALLAATALTIDHFVDWTDAPMPIFVGEPDSARMLLSIIGGAVATLLALIFTVIAVAIQLAVGHYTPRALQILLGDRPTHFTIGVFVGTFTYALIVLLGLRVTINGDVASGVALTLAFGLAVLTIATFAVYSNHIIHSVRPTSLIHRIGDQTRQAVETLYPRLAEGASHERSVPRPDDAPRHLIAAPTSGVLSQIDDRRLLAAAEQAGAIVEIVPPIGAFVPEGAPLAAVHGAPVDAALVVEAITLSPDRTMQLDVSFGFRQLMDIAARALSPGVNDPATAVQVIDALNDLLRRVVVRESLDGSRYDDSGAPRVVLEMVGWQTLVVLTVDEMRRLGGSSMPVVRRLRALIDDLLSVTPAFRRSDLERQRALLDEAVAANFASGYERELASRADPRGSGM